MTQTFKVGDKVVNEVFGAGEIVYGPYGGSSYFFKGDDGQHHTVTESLCKPAARFKVGDKVRTNYGDRYTIHAGPFHGHTEWYAVEDESGKVWQSQADEMTAVEPEAVRDEGLQVGDVVRIPRDDLAGADVKAGDLLVVKKATPWDLVVHAAPGARLSEWYFESKDVERVDPATVAVVDNVAYDLTARYRDTDGDYWTFKCVDGTVRGDCAGTDRAVSVTEWSNTLADAVREFGPLTRV
jgi:hypothetical protein